MEAGRQRAGADPHRHEQAAARHRELVRVRLPDDSDRDEARLVGEAEGERAGREDGRERRGSGE